MSPTKPKFLFALSSHASYILDGEPHPSGFAPPFHTLKETFDIVIASPQGGEAPLNTNSVTYAKDDEESMEFYRTRPKAFLGVPYVGSHGPMFDLAHHQASHGIIRDLWEAGKVVPAVCHGPAALVIVKLSDGGNLVAGLKVNGFTSREEVAFGTASAMPFMLEDALGGHAGEEDGGEFVDGEMWAEKAVAQKDGRLVTGQNPASARGWQQSFFRRLSYEKR
ncbi:hypothetical protein D0863_07480 [Hortaea werneckii]|uniref:D-lactate dehydratase n=1 Tax=Hortaea werneckii TaxID=91943 RepID=A0A3M7DVH2_HORWE|nr:hypothetical protein D0863_07480 [Hortaea werneckii]